MSCKLLSWALTLRKSVSLGVKQLTEDPSGNSAPIGEDKGGKPKAKKAKADDVMIDEASAGTTNLGALLKAKLDSKK